MKPKDEKKVVPSFDDLVFEIRNKEYGAYQIRKKYNSALVWSILVSVLFIGASVITPFVIERGKPIIVKTGKPGIDIVYQGTNIVIDIPDPKLPKPDPIIPQFQKYVAPMVVDSLPVDNTNKFGTIEDYNANAKNDSIGDQQPRINTEPEIPKNKVDDVIWIVEEKPMFGTGGDNEFRKWIGENIIYPRLPLENGIQGRVLIQFVVERDGSLSSFKIVRSVDPELDNEAIRVLNLSPKWSPGKQQGKAVRVGYTFPITFAIK